MIFFRNYVEYHIYYYGQLKVSMVRRHYQHFYQQNVIWSKICFLRSFWMHWPVKLIKKKLLKWIAVRGAHLLILHIFRSTWLIPHLLWWNSYRWSIAQLFDYFKHQSLRISYALYDLKIIFSILTFNHSSLTIIFPN